MSYMIQTSVRFVFRICDSKLSYLLAHVDGLCVTAFSGGQPQPARSVSCGRTAVGTAEQRTKPARSVAVSPNGCGGVVWARGVCQFLPAVGRASEPALIRPPNRTLWWQPPLQRQTLMSEVDAKLQEVCSGSLCSESDTRQVNVADTRFAEMLGCVVPCIVLFPGREWN